MRLRGLIVVTALATVLVASWTWLLPDGADDDVVDEAPLSYGYYVRNATIYGTDEQGRDLYTLQADSMEQNAADESLALRSLTVDYTGIDAPFALTAEAGWMPRDRGRLELTGAVRIVEQDAAGGEVMVITTETLRLDLNARLAQTDDPVRIELQAGHLVADGLVADLRNERLRLLSNVEGKFNR